MYVDKLDDIDSKYNNTNHIKIKMKPVVVKSTTNKLMIKSLNLKLLVLLEYQNIKIFLRNVTFQIDLKKIL